MFMTPTSVGTPRHIKSRNGLLRLRRELIERMGLNAMILVLFAVTLFAGTIVFLVRSVLTSYEGQQRLLGVTETQSRRIEEQGKQLNSLNDRISRIDQQIAGVINIKPDLNDAERSSVRALALAPKLWAKYGDGVCLIAGSFELVEPGTGRPLRYPETEEDTVESLLVIGTGQQLTFEGKGRIFERDRTFMTCHSVVLAGQAWASITASGGSAPIRTLAESGITAHDSISVFAIRRTIGTSFCVKSLYRRNASTSSVS